MRTGRGLWLLGVPVAAMLGLFLVVSSVRKSDEGLPPPRRVVRVVDGREIVTFQPVPELRKRPGASSPSPSSSPEARPGATRTPVPPDIETAAELSRVQSTFENYRTAVMTQNDALERSLLAVLRRDREAAMAFARQHAAWAESESERAFALRTLADLAH